MTIALYPVLFIWFIFLIGLSFVADKIWSKTIKGRKYRFFIAPGVIIHEFSHILACLLTGAKIHKISLFSREGGYVEHARSRLGFLGNAMIAMAPLFGITLFLWLLIFWFGFRLEFQAINFSADIFGNIKSLISSAWDLFSTGYTHWLFWIFIYLVISLSLALSPSQRDFKNAFFGLIFFFQQLLFRS